jgi:protein-S-isoprenylcysteine O-methyltransferase Ste14
MKPSRKKSLAPRMFPLYALSLALLWLSRPTPAGIAIGSALVLCGEGLRLWAAGHLVKNDRLTVSGPYAHLRHPLYLGSLLVGSGLVVMGGSRAALWLLPIGLAFFFAYYFPYKDRIESARLERRYGAPYRAYLTSVSALRPRWRAWQAEASPGALNPADRWRVERLRANDEHGTAIALAAGVAVLALRPLIPL